MIRIRIKMCGVTRIADAEAAVTAGVDALGFIFHRKSGRNIEPDKARAIIEQLPPFIDTVGVFVDKKRREVEEIIDYCRLAYAQLHGRETPKYCERLARFGAPCQVIKAFRVNPELTPEDIRPYDVHVRGYLLDTYHKQMVGPYAVDVNSGLEIQPGIKDHSRIKSLVSRVRDFEDSINRE